MLLIWKAWTVTAILSDFRPQAESGLWSSTSIYHRTLHCPVFHAPFVLLYPFFALFLRVISEDSAQTKGLSYLSQTLKHQPNYYYYTLWMQARVFLFSTRSCWRFLSARHAKRICMKNGNTTHDKLRRNQLKGGGALLIETYVITNSGYGSSVHKSISQCPDSL